MQTVDVIIPCKNEVNYISKMLDGVFEQDYPAHLVKIYVVDGMSSDGTREVLAGLASSHANLIVLDNPKVTTPYALNTGIKASSSAVVIRMDCHAIYPSNYISYLLEELENLKADNVGVCIETVPANESPTSSGIALAISSIIGVGNSQFRIGINEAKQVDTVPFGCYPRRVFDKIGFFDEDLVRNQDDEFNSRLIKNGGIIYLLPKIKITYFARDSFRKLGKMYFQYGLFKPLSNFKSQRIVSLRQFAPSTLLLLLGALLILSPALSLAQIALFFLFLGYEFSVSLFAAYDFGFKRKYSIRTVLCGILAINIVHFSYGYGFLKGLLQVLFGRRKIQVGLSR